MKHFNLVAIWLFALFFVILSLVACGGESKPQPDITDKTAPTLSSSLPATGTSAVPINTKLALTFSEAMDEDSLELTSNPPITLGTATWNTASTSVVFENDTLAASTPYILNIKAKDVSGNELGQTAIAFTTSKEAPRLVSSDPANGATDIPVEILEITLTFSEAMDEATFKVEPTLEPDVVPNFGENPVDGWILTWNAEATVLTITSSPEFNYFLEDTTYTLGLTGKSKAGLALADTTVTFKTVEDSTPLVIGTTSPFDGSTNTQLTLVDVDIFFNDLVDVPATIAAISSSPSLPCEWQQSATIDNGVEPPMISALSCRSETEQFLPDTTYTIIVGTGAKDTSGNALSAPYVIRFTTIKGMGSLQVNISGGFIGEAKVRVTGPNGYNSGNLSSSTTLSNLEASTTYTVTADNFTIGQGKPTCKTYTPDPTTQTATVNAGKTTTASVSYSSESCADLDP